MYVHQLHDWLRDLGLTALQVGERVVKRQSKFLIFLFFSRLARAVSVLLVKGTHLGTLVLQVVAELVKVLVVFGNAAGVVEVEVGTVQESVGVACWRLLVAKVSVERCSVGVV